MAKGDVVSNKASIAAGANLTYQPSAGVEALITAIGSGAFAGSTPNKMPDVMVNLYNGSLFSTLYKSAGLGQAAVIFMRRPVAINNSVYLRVLNENGLTAFLSYTGIQTK